MTAAPKATRSEPALISPAVCCTRMKATSPTEGGEPLIRLGCRFACGAGHMWSKGGGPHLLKRVVYKVFKAENVEQSHVWQLPRLIYDRREGHTRWQEAKAGSDNGIA